MICFYQIKGYYLPWTKRRKLIDILLKFRYNICNSSEKIRRLIKARDSYGLVFDDVKKMQAMKQLRDVESGPNPPPPGTTESDSSNANETTSIVPFTETNALTRSLTSAPQNQLTNLIRKAPTMPKPKWHAPWKLYRVIAGHLGWVRCVAVEPGNEVR